MARTAQFVTGVENRLCLTNYTKRSGRFRPALAVSDAGAVSCVAPHLDKDATLNAIVTGGAGFIGSHLCAALLDRGLFVTCIDNLVSGSSRNIEHLLEHPSFRFLQHDVTEPLAIDQVDRIYHLASPASVVDYLNHPVETLRANSVGTLAMLELARQMDARLLYTSTSEAYGDPHVHPQVETYWGNVNPVGIRACYDESKRFGEAATMAYRRSYGIDARVVRIFNTYGPHSRVDDGRIVPNFIAQALRGERITVYGDGLQTRSFCYVSDMVRGLMAAMDSVGTAGEVINLGNPEEHTVLEFAQIIAQQVGSSAGIVHRPLPTDDPSRRQPDITKARTLLSWEPEVGLREGLDRTIAWFRGILNLSAMV